MKTTAIIAEYNPFHNGHHHQFNQIRNSPEHGYLVVVMSGNFVQRGEPAIYDKYTRTRAALNAGADLVLELPAPFAISSAEDFAACGVTLLNQLGIIDELCFGSESGDINLLTEIARILAREPEGFGTMLRQELKTGSTYPQARNQALITWLNNNSRNNSPDLSPDTADNILASPNNILGIEYIKAIIRQQSRIKPVTICRRGQGYHDLSVSRDFASASGIRRAILRGSEAIFPEFLAHQVPELVLPYYRQAIPLFADDLSLLLNQTLLALDYNNIPFSRYADLSEEIAARLQKQLLRFCSFTERIGQLKTKQYTYTRISRALLHLLLGITDDDMNLYRQTGCAPYARVLGFRKTSVPLLTSIKQHSRIPLITKTADAEELLSGPGLMMFKQDLYCSHVYQVLQQQKSGETPRNEYTQSVIIL